MQTLGTDLISGGIKRRVKHNLFNGDDIKQTRQYEITKLLTI